MTLFPKNSGLLDRFKKQLWEDIGRSLRTMNVSPGLCVESTGLLPIGVDVFFAKASVGDCTLDEIVEFAFLMGITVKASAKL